MLSPNSHSDLESPPTTLWLSWLDCSNKVAALEEGFNRGKSNPELLGGHDAIIWIHLRKSKSYPPGPLQDMACGLKSKQHLCPHQSNEYGAQPTQWAFLREKKWIEDVQGRLLSTAPKPVQVVAHIYGTQIHWTILFYRWGRASRCRNNTTWVLFLALLSESRRLRIQNFPYPFLRTHPTSL